MHTHTRTHTDTCIYTHTWQLQEKAQTASAWLLLVTYLLLKYTAAAREAGPDGRRRTQGRRRVGEYMFIYTYLHARPPACG